MDPAFKTHFLCVFLVYSLIYTETAIPTTFSGNQNERYTNLPILVDFDILARMPPKALIPIPKAPLESLIQKSRSQHPSLNSFSFPHGTTMKTLVEAVDLRIDVHAHPDDPTIAPAKIQPNAQARDRAIQDMIKSATKGPHQGTHQVFRTFKMGLGPRFPSMEVFEDAIRGKCTEAVAPEPQPKSSAAPPGWFFDKGENNFYRMTLEGRSYFKPPPEAKEGMWVKEFGRLLYVNPDGEYEWKPQPE